METETHFSSETDEWATPPELLRPLADAVGGFDLDPCSGAERKSIASDTYTKADDGLAQKWFGAVWMNPPYSEIADWMEKASTEVRREQVDSVIALVPARTSTQWFHNYAAEASAIAFVEGRLQFGDADNSAPFPSAVVVFGDVEDDVYSFLSNRGMVFHDYGREQRTEQTRLLDNRDRQ